MRPRPLIGVAIGCLLALVASTCSKPALDPPPDALRAALDGHPDAETAAARRVRSTAEPWEMAYLRRLDWSKADAYNMRSDPTLQKVASALRNSVTARRGPGLRALLEGTAHAEPDFCDDHVHFDPGAALPILTRGGTVAATCEAAVSMPETAVAECAVAMVYFMARQAYPMASRALDCFLARYDDAMREGASIDGAALAGACADVGLVPTLRGCEVPRDMSTGSATDMEPLDLRP